MRKQILSFSIASLMLTLTSSAVIQADTSYKKSKYHFWLGFSGQKIYSGDFHSFNGSQVNLNFSFHQKHFIRYKNYGGPPPDWDVFAVDPIEPNRLIRIQNHSLMYGFGKYFTRYFAIVPFAGISHGETHWRGDYLYTDEGTGWFAFDTPVYEEEEYWYIGFPVEISFMLTSRWAGISLDVYSNFHKHPDYGFSISLMLGKIRNKK